ncbi:hypothetical protein M2103_001048 [Ereboglobus sp. PH5-5]|uniref:DMP19 family protein n=1 Tax=Ereboglobus sp. PH5-5 TaxID=2940529 RepID=UPI002404BC9E|nr:DUF4375 domain-containing protein [Ereboglobus sp. PH5-5]MDF9832834.1 hypothetical protein [Ereboglobus sp. PH5-5]
MSQDSETRIKCIACDRLVLPVTAKFNDGLCGYCIQHVRRKKFDEIVAGWMRDPSTLPGTNGIPEPSDFALAIKAAELRDLRTLRGKQREACGIFFSEAYAKWYESGPDALTPKEKHILAIETFIGEITNGGIIQYLGNESHAFANWAAEGFDQIGFPKYANIARRITSLFPYEVIPEDDEKCCEIVEDIDGKIFEGIEKDFNQAYNFYEAVYVEKLYSYISK